MEIKPVTIETDSQNPSQEGIEVRIPRVSFAEPATVKTGFYSCEVKKVQYVKDRGKLVVEIDVDLTEDTTQPITLWFPMTPGGVIYDKLAIQKYKRLCAAFGADPANPEDLVERAGEVNVVASHGKVTTFYEIRDRDDMDKF